jgi:hypothetical protein
MICTKIKDTKICRYKSNGIGSILGSGMITMANGSQKKVSDIQPGDLLLGGKVICVVRMISTASLCKIGSLEITPLHPIKLPTNVNWVYPMYLPHIMNHYKDVYLYDFVLEGSSYTINGIKCASLGHKLKDPVVEDPFYGSNKIIDILKNIRIGVKDTLHLITLKKYILI